MTLQGMRTRTSDDCLSDRRLDALLAGELDGNAQDQAERHLASCARCAERRSALSADAVSFLAAHPPDHARVLSGRSDHGPGVAPVVARRRARGLWWGAGTALAAAAALLLMVRPHDLEERSKGPGSVGFFVRHGEKVRRGGPNERVLPGDALRFVVTQREPSYVAVLSRDAAGQASVYFPAAARAVRVEAGVEKAVDTSVVLDDVLGTERLYALRCERPIELAPLRAQLGASASEPAWPEGCQVERLTILKVWPP